MTVPRPAAPLSDAALPGLPNGVLRPTYDRADLVPGIVHVGVGNFHRSHLAVHIDDLLAAGHRGWAICGVGLRPYDRLVHDALASQDGLYSVVTLRPDGGRDVRVVGSIVEHLLAEDDLEAVLDRMAAPSTRILSLTVTEGGYYQRPDRTVDLDHPELRADAATPDAPRTIFGVLVAALARRRERGHGPVTVMSCDNLPGNGAVTREGVIGLAGRVDPALAAWIAEHASFPSAMVDRITPATTDALRAWLRDDAGVVDAWPVPAEPFTQWVLEDDFAAGRPPFEASGAQLVADVAPYELRKLRLLNGGHQAVAHVGRLVGHDVVREALADPDVRRFVTRYLQDEARTTLPPAPGMDPGAYVDTLVDRFANPYVADTLSRLATDASARLPQFVVPVVRARRAAGDRAPLALAVVAAWEAGLVAGGQDGSPPEVPDAAIGAGPWDAGRAAALVRDVLGDLADDAVVQADLAWARAAVRGGAGGLAAAPRD
ncbi:mannitol dehydrogenase family protein [Patulibacter americanus]|uniref:mannitol dehydrogenase family protein n=1 Tax=Patulibacter americanus TaxID=588672 RepID=UPI0003B31739|nr:mannitol dehydrogenase family protein [Patulibacter americanus]